MAGPHPDRAGEAACRITIASRAPDRDVRVAERRIGGAARSPDVGSESPENNEPRGGRTGAGTRLQLASEAAQLAILPANSTRRRAWCWMEARDSSPTGPPAAVTVVPYGLPPEAKIAGSV